jgi:diaminopimelate decarboxylase
MLSPNAYAIAANKMADLALGLKLKFNKKIEYIDMGGGFCSKNTLKGSYLQGSDYIPEMAEYAEAICSTLLNAGFQSDDLPYLYIESGRALIDDAGFICGSVIANKRLSDGRKATIMDFGVNLMFTAFWYDHKITPAQEFGYHTEETVLYGPLCMNIDVVRESITLPPLNAGDQVVVHYVGAYCLTQSMQFISLRPNVVLIDMEDNVHVIKQNELLTDLESGEKMPKHLQN